MNVSRYFGRDYRQGITRLSSGIKQPAKLSNTLTMKAMMNIMSIIPKMGRQERRWLEFLLNRDFFFKKSDIDPNPCKYALFSRSLVLMRAQNYVHCTLTEPGLFELIKLLEDADEKEYPRTDPQTD